jgi:outer membrane protein OmpA-like peptidoglycan-associated protein
MKKAFSVLCAALAGGWLLVACATPPNRSLIQARADYAAAEADAVVQAHAPTALRDAHQALMRAEQAEANRRSDEEVDHLAYLASRRVQIARVMAERIARAPRAAAPGTVVYPAPGTVVYPAQGTVVAPPTVVSPNAVVVPAPAPATATEARVETLANELAAALQDLRTSRNDRGVAVSVEDVLFEPGQSTLNSAALADLARLADYLERHPELDVQIGGYSDGSANDALLAARARAVESYLVMRGVEAPRIVTYSRPYASVGRPQDRRVEILVVD